MRRLLVAGCVAMLLGVWTAQAAAETGRRAKLPWSQRIPDEHPRLLFARDDIPRIRAAFEAPIHKKWYAWMRQKHRTGCDVRTAPNAAILWLLTGERVYKDEVVRVLEDCCRKPPGLERTYTVVLAFDWIYSDLSEAERRKFATFLTGYDLKPKRGVSMACYNIWAANGRGALAAIAAYGAPGVDNASLEKVLDLWDPTIDEMVKLLVRGEGTWWTLAGSWYGLSATRGTGHIFLKGWSVLDPGVLQRLRPYHANMVRWAYYVEEPHTGQNPWVGKTGFSVKRDNAPSALIAALWKDPVAQWRYHELVRSQRTPRARGKLAWWMMFYDPRLKPAPPSTYGHPSAAFGVKNDGPGWVVMKSDWSPDATYMLFRCGCVWDAHGQRSINAFILSRKGHLAVRDGYRCGTDIGPDWAYLCSSTSQNTITILTPEGERGQRAGKRFRGGRILAWEANKTYDYVAADAAEGYPAANLFARQIVFLRPQTFLIFDRVEPTEAASSVQWLLHTVNEPKLVSGKEAGSRRWEEGLTWFEHGSILAATEGDGKLFCRKLFPTEAVFARRGGFEIGEVVPGEKNKGNGTVKGIKTFPKGVPAVWTLTCTDTKGGGVFKVEGKWDTSWAWETEGRKRWRGQRPDWKPSFVTEGTALVGEGFTAHLALKKKVPWISFTVTAGRRPFAAGDTFTFQVRSYRFWMNGKNRPPDPRGSYARVQLVDKPIAGWRVQTVCGARAAAGGILHVLYAGDREEKEMPPAEPISADDRVGAKVTVGTKVYEVTFNKTRKVGGHIKITDDGKVILDRDLASDVQNHYKAWKDDPRRREWMVETIIEMSGFP